MTDREPEAAARSVVVAYIPTPEGDAALELGIREARLRQLPLVVVNVHRDDALSDERVIVAEEAGRVEARLQSADVPGEIINVHATDVSEAIVQVAHDNGADLLVIGVRRRSPVGKLILGSHALEVIMHAHCPVLTVRAAEQTPE